MIQLAFWSSRRIISPLQSEIISNTPFDNPYAGYSKDHGYTPRSGLGHMMRRSVTSGAVSSGALARFTPPDNCYEIHLFIELGQRKQATAEESQTISSH